MARRAGQGVPRRTVVLDAGVLIAAEKGGTPTFNALLKAFSLKQVVGLIPSVVLAEVWRGGRGQEHLSRVLRGMGVADCDELHARRAGHLLSLTGGGTTIDAIVVATAERNGYPIATGDPGDLRPLAERAVGVELL